MTNNSNASSEYKAIKVTKEGPVDWLILNRPDKLNALNPDMIRELRMYFYSLIHDNSVRIVVMQGAGRSFCAGLDLSIDYSNIEGPGAGFALQQSISDIIIQMRRCPQPIIGLLQGYASGGGFSIAAATDIRIGANDLKFNAAFIKVGLTGCDLGISYHLPRLVGKSVASEILMTGRFIDAKRALEIGLISKLVEPEQLVQEAREYCQDMLETSPVALRLTKQCIDLNVDATGLESAIALEDRQQNMCLLGKDFHEGINAFTEKRKPDFKEY